MLNSIISIIIKDFIVRLNGGLISLSIKKNCRAEVGYVFLCNDGLTIAEVVHLENNYGAEVMHWLYIYEAKVVNFLLPKVNVLITCRKI